MNFDRLAPYYPWLENLFAGGRMQRCRTTFLAGVKNCRRALLVGEGPGKFLVELLQANPMVHVTCVEACGGMIRQMRRRLAQAGLDAARVSFVQSDALNWVPAAESFDLVATHFFLDCFPAGQLKKLIPQLAAGTHPEAVWLVADFRLPEKGWRRWPARVLLGGLYAFFRMTTCLAANRLTPPDPFLVAAGFQLVERRVQSFGLTHADFWRRDDSNFSDLAKPDILRT